MKRGDQTSSSKALSKNSGHTREKNTSSQKQLTETNDMSQISYLERKLNEQIITRQQSYDELFKMIKHLNEIKKSKVPTNYDNLSSLKLLSPRKQPTAQNPQLNQIRSEFSSQQTNQYNQLQEQISQLRVQIEQMKMQAHPPPSPPSPLIHQLQQQLQQSYNHLQKQIAHSANNSPMLESLYQRISQQSIHVQNYGNQIQRISKDIANLNYNLTLVNDTIRNLENIVLNQFQRVQERVMQTDRSIQQAKHCMEQILYNKNGNSDTYESISHLDNRILGIQRRIDLIYHEYLSMPLKRI